MAKKGVFITFEGGEGSGKSKTIWNVHNFLTRDGFECIVTREPGGTEIGKKIRAILLSPESGDMNSFTELLLFMADRAQHVGSFVKPLLKKGKIVLCDRFSDSNIVYQGHARGLGEYKIRLLHWICGLSIKPDMTVLLDLPPEVGLMRVGKDCGHIGSESRIDSECLSFHRKIRKGFLSLAEQEPERWFVVDVENNDEIKTSHIVYKEIKKRFLRGDRRWS